MHILYIKDENGEFVPIKTLKGADGKSAYESAVEGGFIGTYEDFCTAISQLESIQELAPYVQHLNNKDNPHGVTAEKIGAIPAAYYRSDDLNTELAAGGNKMTVCYYDSDTLNTPKTEGITDYAHGMVITNAHTDGRGYQYGTQLCIPSGENSMYLRRYNRSGQTLWLKISPEDITTQLDKTVKKTGGTLTGAITVDKDEPWGQYVIQTAGGCYRSLEANDQVLRLDVRDGQVTKERRYIDICSKTYDGDHSTALRFTEVTDGATSTAYVLHTKNKPKSTYVGDGKARTINTGGIGNLLLLWVDGGGIMLISPVGCVFLVTGGSGDVNGNKGAVFADGVLTITGGNYSMDNYNKSGVTYHYQVL